MKIHMIYKTTNQTGSPDDESQEGKDISDHEIETVLNESESSILSLPPNTPQPFILAIVGMIASGKSTIIQPIAKHFSLVNISTDKIRRLLSNNDYNLRRTSDITFHLVNKYLSKGYGIAVDADAIAKHNRDEMLKISDKFSVPILFLHVVTPEKIILERLNEKNLKREYRGEEAINRYFARKHLHEEIDLDFIYTFDGSSDFDRQVNEAIDIISTQINVQSSSK